ncbi:MAG: hypothetical protein ACI4EU_00850 [Butyrivibrio sp.]
METTVNLHDPYSYPLWPVLTAAAVLLILGIVIIILLVRKKNNGKGKNTMSFRSRSDVVNKYLKLIDEVESKHRNGEYSVRKCYEELSLCVREFVYEATGINVTTCTLADIRKLKMPSLEALIAKYYHPEFSEKSGFDAEKAIIEAKRVITAWN